MERLAQYIIRNPFSVEKMRPNSSGDSIIYRSGMNPKIGRNFEVLSPCDFIARITRHIPDKSFQLVRYYGWYSNKMRGQRLKRAEPEGGAADAGSEVIEHILRHLGLQPRQHGKKPTDNALLRPEMRLGLPAFAIVGVFDGRQRTILPRLLADMKIAAAFLGAREQLSENVFEEVLSRAGGGHGQRDEGREEETMFHRPLL